MKVLQERLRDAGFEVIDDNIRSCWNPTDETLAAVPELVGNLLGGKADDSVEETAVSPLRKWKCGPCGYIYDPAVGDPDSGIAPGTPFEQLPDDWSCPTCGVSKDLFSPID